MKSDIDISEDRLKKIKKMHEFVYDFIDSLVDITGIRKDNKRMLTPYEMETFLILSLESSAIITANSLLNLFKTIKDKEEQEQVITQILKQLEKGIKVHLTNSKEDESQPIN